MQAHYVVKRPILTEKSTFAMNEGSKRYAFEVDRGASKDQIKAAVQHLYNVRVTGVNTMVSKGKKRRLKYGVITEPTTKKAIVRLHPEDTIELF
ncbi:MAG: 50S ribosomal protein L23 [Phycisphaerales bacterium]